MDALERYPTGLSSLAHQRRGIGVTGNGTLTRQETATRRHQLDG
ncbi:hypothetical protein trd_1416 [Thermomicrobium roseum DSM 5159]|uniref:Uncharacterized protein n=1 Tax=Thermomicrobium roseum (strain ATCC 27502 / DSM 5159 / P-2) TaxID=309801 RepID=B9L2L4_THERP|nr:hypothetical protein trd_1416 [Thermomicrobium roseum DSM 5159]